MSEVLVRGIVMAGLAMPAGACLPPGGGDGEGDDPTDTLDGIHRDTSDANLRDSTGGADSGEIRDDAADGTAPDVRRDGDAEGGELTPEEFLTEYSWHAYCEDVLECEAKAGLAVLLEIYCHDRATMRELAADFLPDSGPGGRYDFDPEAARQCLTKFENEPRCEGAVGPAGANYLDQPPCSSVFTPRQSRGDPCTSRVECKKDLECVLGSSCPGTCESLAGKDDSCEATDDCASGLYCNLSSSTCESQGGSGASCSSADACKNGFWCNSNDSCVALPSGKGDACDTARGGQCPGELVCGNGTCQRGLSKGDTCNDQTPPCAPGLRCVESSNECRPVHGPGESCGGPGTCILSHYCDNGTCKPRPTAGESCSNPPGAWQSSDVDFCFRGTCISGTCAMRKNGESCSASGFTNQRQCKNGYCASTSSSGGVCKAPKSENDPCSDSSECGSGLTCRENDSGDEVCLQVCSGS